MPCFISREKYTTGTVDGKATAAAAIGGEDRNLDKQRKIDPEIDAVFGAPVLGRTQEGREPQPPKVKLELARMISNIRIS